MPAEDIPQQPAPLPRLGPIYLRDVLHLTDRALIETCRRVSTHFNATICTTPERKVPRRVFHHLGFAGCGEWPRLRKLLIPVLFRISPEAGGICRRDKHLSEGLE